MVSVDRKPELGEELLHEAASNYIGCLHLPKGSNVLIIKDTIQTDEGRQLGPNFAVRHNITQLISQHLFGKGHNLESVAFDNSMDEGFIHEGTTRSLEHFSETGGSPDAITTILYLGDAWDGRRGIYTAASEFGKSRNGEVRIAGSLGFSTGDCRVMAQMSRERRAMMRSANMYFRDFLGTHPEGVFNIKTSDTVGHTYELSLHYNNRISPFEVDLGEFSEDHKISLLGSTYVNIPGGERFALPYPYDRTQGKFAAEGFVFAVTHGMVYDFVTPGGIPESLGLSQKLLLNKVSQGKRMPLSELGLGFYALAGIETFPDCSILSREKGGPHFGLGEPANEGTPESELIRGLAGDFHHTDFVLDEPMITRRDLQSGEDIRFYPPKK
jgi:hypothetical protein